MNWPHYSTGWKEKCVGLWFIQYCVFSQWSQERHAITLFALSIDPWARSDRVGRSNRFLMVGFALLGVCFHITLCKRDPQWA